MYPPILPGESTVYTCVQHLRLQHGAHHGWSMAPHSRGGAATINSGTLGEGTMETNSLQLTISC